MAGQRGLVVLWFVTFGCAYPQFYARAYPQFHARRWERDTSTGAIINLLHEWIGQCDADALQIVDNLVVMCASMWVALWRVHARNFGF